VKIVVDANIVISTLLKTDGVVAELLMRAAPRPKFHVPEFVRTELSLHRVKLVRLAGSSLDDMALAEEVVLSGLTTVPAEFTGSAPLPSLPPSTPRMIIMWHWPCT
jgi:hypothetical protein